MVLLHRRVRRNKHICKEKDQRAYSQELFVHREMTPESLQDKNSWTFLAAVKLSTILIFLYFVRKKVSYNYNGSVER